ncbi:helix-turn-helix domain-containing protein [Rhodococcus hoagii]|nr:helix-turn-helix domain-containing protein [Prescottella equi]
MDADRRLPEADVVRDAIANEIRALRGRRRMTQADLIRESGLSRATIGRIEKTLSEIWTSVRGLQSRQPWASRSPKLLQAVQDSLEGKQL